MYFSPDQLLTSLLVVLVFASTAGLLVFYRGPWRRAVRRWGTHVLGLCAVAAVVSWLGFGDFHSLWVDAPGAVAGSPGRAKVERHLPLHFHEFFHYYIGAKYFRELGYEGLYDCTALADAELAEEQQVAPRIAGYVRDLDDVLTDKTYEEAKAHCRDGLRPGFSDERWAAFKHDLRELQRLAPDGWWSGVVFDAGFNPPPSWVVVGGAFANAIPIRVGSAPTFLVATSLDVLLLVACFLALRRAFGAGTAVTVAIFFGASFIASYGWNGGAFLRYTWIAAVVLGMVALQRGRWVLAGALFGAATCDRLFPIGFALGAIVPVAVRALRSPAERRLLIRFGAGFSGIVAVLVLVSVLLFGTSSWHVFFSRIFRHGDVYYTMHIGLKKVLTWRPWVASQNFHDHLGLQNFRRWNLRLHATWAAMRPVAVPIQLVGMVGAGYASVRRRPYEAALLCGVCAMFLFSIPANYYYVVLAVVPAVILRAAMTAPSASRRLREYAVLTAFTLCWVTTLISSRWSNDDIIFNHLICVAIGLFLAFWVGSWAAGTFLRRRRSAA
ncbi:MAG TPA: hypothetical protein VIF15_18450 [Polyangiaceae bacterium]